MEKPLVTVIIPIYNGEIFIKKCIDCLIEQSYTNIECVIVDDGSTDNTKKLVKNIVEEVKIINIRFISQSRQGVSVARNSGIDVAKGKYIIFIDADDTLDRDAIDHSVQLLEDHNLDLLIFGYYFDIPQTNNKVEQIPNCYKNILIQNAEELRDKLVDLYDANLMYNIWNKVFKREIISNNSIRFPIGKVYNEDRDFVRDYLRNAERIEVISDCYYHYYRNQSSTTGVYRSDLFDIRKEEYYRMKDFFSSIGLEDEKTEEYISRQHLDRVMGCVENTFYLLDKNGVRSLKEIRNNIYKMINDELTIESVKKTVPKSKKMKIMTIPYKTRSVNTVFLMTLFIHHVKNNYPQLFHKLKQAR